MLNDSIAYGEMYIKIYTKGDNAGMLKQTTERCAVLKFLKSLVIKDMPKVSEKCDIDTCIGCKSYSFCGHLKVRCSYFVYYEVVKAGDERPDWCFINCASFMGCPASGVRCNDFVKKSKIPKNPVEPERRRCCSTCGFRDGEGGCDKYVKINPDGCCIDHRFPGEKAL